MSWASHPTNEMPATLANPAGRRRRRSSIIGISAAALLVPVVVGAMLSPNLLGAPPPPSNAAGNQLASPSGSQQPASPSLILSSTPAATPTPTSTAAPALLDTPTAAKVTPSTRSATALDAAGNESLATEVVRLTDVERIAHGCVRLRTDTKLRTAAQDHSAEMASLQQLTSTGADGSTPGARMKLAGYNTDGGWAENVAAGYPTPQAVMTGWMNSEGHRNNILNCSLKAIGMGVARAGNGQLYWTQDFGGR
jgi:uncharacterized protein YkwD